MTIYSHAEHALANQSAIEELGQSQRVLVRLTY